MTTEIKRGDNLILIGMPGCGKSTLGVLLAKVLCLSFLDTDLLIQEQAGMRLQEIIDRNGLDVFRRQEEQILTSLSTKATLVATGGSAIYYPRAMENLRALGAVVYLKAPLSSILDHLADFSERGIAMPSGMSIESLYMERAPLYERYADIVTEVTSESITENMERVRSSLRAASHPLFS